ncbi:DUF3833 family protein [Sphingosinicella sp. YJ22]|uniref:DUF3833 family protein n=1 Tax=Sphingosinicella sp. YJ22 TaxID=1104780 RepID=UPI001408B3FE|nr:DUF3833 family protein [Sphingosinicella sp. YJ22]
MLSLTPILAFLIAFQPQPAPSALERFFAGRTEGSGSVRIILSGTSAVRTQGRGRILADGSLHLDHVVNQEGEPERRRTWRMRRSGPGRYTGTISDARGPVSAELHGNRVHVTYRTREGYAVDQWITFNGDGRTASNQMTFRRMGVRVATLQETIRRVD